VGTGLERTTDTSADGSYALPELPIGTYTVDGYPDRLPDLRDQGRVSADTLLCRNRTV